MRGKSVFLRKVNFSSFYWINRPLPSFKAFSLFIVLFSFLGILLLPSALYSKPNNGDHPYSSPPNYCSLREDQSGRQLKPDWSKLVPLIRQFVQSSMKEIGVPGLALAIVENNKVVLVEGFGWRDIEARLPVTSQTCFILGSTTKAFTTLAMAMLVEEGKISWDEPVRNYLPEFALKDEWATLRCTPRDLVTHRTGLPRHDLVWSGATLGPEEIVKVLRFLEPSRDFRTTYQYNNLMYIVAGVLIGRVAGLPWEDFLKQRIFTPLGMKNSGCTLQEYLASPEYSQAYNRRGEEYQALVFPSPEKKIMFGPRASGSVFSTAKDMARWLLFHLNEGEIEGQRLISAARLRELHTPQIIRPVNPAEIPDIDHPSYALGWMIDSYRGHYRVHHGGSTMGFSSYVVLFPREKFGAALLTNLNSNLPLLVANYISDLALGLPPIDWRKRLSSGPKPSSPPKPFASSEFKPISPLADYTGEFSHPAYGQIKVNLEGDKLFLIFRDEKIELLAFGPDLFRPREASWQRFSVHFERDQQGMITSVAIPFEPAIKEITFIKKMN